MSAAPVLEARHITKRFGGVQALTNVAFDVLPGEIHALCGENGAGKSTLMKVLTGLYPAGSFDGQVLVDGEPACFADIRDSEQAGIGIVHQELALVDELTVAENILLGNYPKRRGRIDWFATYSQAAAIPNRFNVAIAAETLVAELGVGQQQLVEIARALSREPRILLLDEPTAALSSAETAILLDQVRRLCTSGVACIYISHKLDEVLQIANRITVLRDGQSIVTASRETTDASTIVRHMVGREIADVYPRRMSSPRQTLALEVNDLSADSDVDHHVSLRQINLQVHAGEVVGIGGLMGAGRSELLMHLYGLWGRTVSGEVALRGSRYDGRSPRRSIARGMMLVTESRKRYGLIPNQSTQHNLSLSSLPAVTRYGRLLPTVERRRNAAMLEKMHFRALHGDVEVGQLSGGNQQKVVLGRGLLTDPQAVLLDEPTRGVDVGAKREIYEEVNRLAAEGKAILMVSSELPELMGMCDRIIMMREGSVAGQFADRPFDASQLASAALGAGS